MLFYVILLGTLSLATFFFTSQISTLLADAINFGTPTEIYWFGGVWLGLLGISITLAIAAIREAIHYNNYRPRKPRRDN